MINIQNICFRYRRGRDLFEELSLSLPKGSICGLLGKNGEGKTTLLKLIAGSLIAKRGEISVLGMPSSSRKPALLQQVFLLPEIVSTPTISVGKYLDTMGKFYPRYDSRVAEEALRTLDVYKDMLLGRISQGQQKKVAITLALAVRTPLLLMDEPTNSLDIPSKAAFRQLMAKYMDSDQTVLISTHQVRDLESMIDRIVMLEQNRIVCNETIERLSQKFRFALCKEENEAPLYSELTPMGTMGVYPSHESCNTNEYFSIELFFNGMISNPQHFAEQLRKP